jgi:hypothetical protein
MTNVFVALVAVGSLWLAAFVAVQTLTAWRRWRGTRLITCPENRRPAAVELDMRFAVAGAVLGRPELRLRDCSRWPERAGCGQVCLAQIDEAPEACDVRTMVERWYEGKRCAYCRRAFDAIRWHDHKPGLRAPDGRVREWADVPPETLTEVLRTHQPVCWNCLVAEGFRLRFPDRVVERPHGASGVRPPEPCGLERPAPQHWERQS